MQTFKLTPTPQSDYRLEIRELKKLCRIERHGYRHNKIVYGFAEILPALSELQALGLDIEELSFNETQLVLVNTLVARGRAKSKLDHLLHDQEFNGAENSDEVNQVHQKLNMLNNKIQEAKGTLGIDGTVKILKF